MKRVFSLILSLILIFNVTFVSFSYATTVDDIIDIDPIGGSVPSDTTESLNPNKSDLDDLNGNSTLDTVYKATGLFAKIIGYLQDLLSIFTNPLQWIILALPTIDGSIFNTQNYFRLSFFEKNATGLAGQIQGPVSAIYNALRYLVTVIYIIVLVYLAIRMMLSSIGRQKAHYKELFKHWLVGLLLLFSFHWIMAFIIWISNTFVQILGNLTSEILVSEVVPNFSTLRAYPITTFVLSRISAISSANAMIYQRLGPLAILLPTILNLVFIGFTLSITMIYLKRLFTVSVLILTFPLVALSYVFDKIGDRKAQTLGIWLKEFVVNVAIQPLHALILVLIAILYNTGSADTQIGAVVGTGLFGKSLIGAVMSLLTLRLLSIGEEYLKKIFQINSTMGPGAQGISGSIARAGMAIKGTKELAGSIGKGAKTISSLKPLLKTRNDLVAGKDKKFWNDKVMADKGKKGNAFSRATAKKDYIKNSEDFNKVKEAVLKQNGAKSFKELNAKTAALVGGASFGVGSAIAGARNGEFLSTAAKNIALSNEAVDGIDKVRKTLGSDKERSAEYKKLSDKVNGMNLNNLSQKDKEKIAADLGINVNLVDNAHKNDITKGYEQMARMAGLGIQDNQLKDFTSIYQGQKNVLKGLSPDGKTELDLNNVKGIFQAKDGIYGEVGGTVYQLGYNGNSSLKDGEKRYLNTDLKGKSVRENASELLANNIEYQDLQRTVNDSNAEYERLRTISTDNTEYNRLQKIVNDNAEYNELQSTLNNNSEYERYQKISDNFDAEPEVRNNARAKMAEIETKRNNAQARMAEIETERNNARIEMERIQEERSNAKDEMKRVEKTRDSAMKEMQRMERTEVQKTLAVDEALYTMGVEPIYTETQIKNNNLETAKENAFNTSSIQYAASEYIHATQTYNAARKANNYPTDQLQTLENNMQAASDNFTSAETEVNRLVSSAIGNDRTLQERYSFDTNNVDSSTEAFSYGVCNELSEILDAWSSKAVTVKLTRTSDTVLTYSIFSNHTGSKNAIAYGSIDLDDSSFNCDSLTNTSDSIIISPTKDGWFKK